MKKLSMSLAIITVCNGILCANPIAETNNIPPAILKIIDARIKSFLVCSFSEEKANVLLSETKTKLISVDVLKESRSFRISQSADVMNMAKVQSYDYVLNTTNIHDKCAVNVTVFETHSEALRGMLAKYVMNSMDIIALSQMYEISVDSLGDLCLIQKTISDNNEINNTSSSTPEKTVSILRGNAVIRITSDKEISDLIPFVSDIDAQLLDASKNGQ